MKINPHKTISATAEGITISYRESYKYQFLGYQNGCVLQPPRKKYQTFDKPAFNHKQQKLYSETVYGLNAFTKAEVKQMSAQRKRSIIQKYTACQDVLNEWKQDIVNQKVDHFLQTLFPHSKLVKFITGFKSVDTTIVNRHTFKELGINQVDIARKLIEVGILPKDFFTLEHSI